MNEFFSIVLGGYSIFQIFGFIWFFVVGYIIYALTETTGRDIKSKNTPKKWYWKFWFFDNWRRYLLTIFITYVYFIFYTQISGHSFENFDALLLGLVGDGTGALIKKRVKYLTKNRKKLMNDINEE